MIWEFYTLLVTIPVTTIATTIHTINIIANAIQALNNRCLALSPWCGRAACEEDIKERTQNEAQNVDEANTEDAGGFLLMDEYMDRIFNLIFD